jgi:LPPG:FO 2-phospho-L-lactate transferase
MRALGAKVWFQLGDLDLATHLYRTELLASGKTLTEATAELCRAMGVKVRLLPMSDDAVSTVVNTPDGELHFQEYFVRERAKPPVLEVTYEGAGKAATAAGVLQAIIHADLVLIAPSNPVTSIGPILAVPGVRDALRCTTAQVVAVSPIVGGAAVSGPAGEMLKMRGFAISAAGIAGYYRDLIDALIVDARDEKEREAIANEKVHVAFTNTIMTSDEDKIALATFALATVAREAAR